MNDLQIIVGCGTAFVVSAAGAERVLHSFSGYPNDGAAPYGNLIELNAELYGTTSLGGYTVDTGIVLAMNTAGGEHLVYRFFGVRGAGYNPDGSAPYGGLTAVSGNLYGTTTGGGTSGIGAGTAFVVSTTGVEHLLYSFPGFPGGDYPFAGLTLAGGHLHGVTSNGGLNFSGTVFELTSAGERLVYTFTGYPYGPDGLVPYGGLLPFGNTLYGTTVGGGASGDGQGAVYAVTTAGAERILYSFKNTPDGAAPHSGLIYVGGNFYGTTTAGEPRATEPSSRSVPPASKRPSTVSKEHPTAPRRMPD